jgi:hypothetical protein
MCSSYNCPIRLKFDSKSASQIEGTEPEDGRTDSIFLRPESTLLTQIRKSETLRVEATFFEEGRHILEFPIEGLNPKF